jgi:hypothetical protein
LLRNDDVADDLLHSILRNGFPPLAALMTTTTSPFADETSTCP